MNKALSSAKTDIIAIGKQFYQERGWSVATSSNYSCRIDDNIIAITASGKHKGKLTEDDIITIDPSGNPLDSSQRPSAETALHALLYRYHADIGAVLHTHSVNCTVLSKLYAPIGQLPLNNYEMLKALNGVDDHKTQACLPIFPNSQDMDKLAEQVQTFLNQDDAIKHGFLLSGHGLYAWGATLEDAHRHVEALEFMFECEVLTLQIGFSATHNHLFEVIKEENVT